MPSPFPELIRVISLPAIEGHMTGRINLACVFTLIYLGHCSPTTFAAFVWQSITYGHQEMRGWREDAADATTLREIFEKVGKSDDLGLSQNSELLLHFF